MSILIWTRLCGVMELPALVSPLALEPRNDFFFYIIGLRENQ